MRFWELPAALSAFLSLAALACPPAAAEKAPPSSRIHALTLNAEVNADGTATLTTHVELYADNAAAAMNAGQTKLGYDATMQQLDVVEAHTKKKDGREIPVAISAIYDQLAPGEAQVPMFTDERVKVIVFPQFEAGDTAVYTIRTTLKQPYFPGQFWYGDLFHPSIAYDDVRETITAPSSMALQVESHNVAFHKEQNGDRTVYSWQYAAPVPKPLEAVAVSPILHAPRFFISTFHDYAALGRSYAAAATSAAAVTPAIQALADSITQGSTDPRDQAEKIYAWVSAHIRYVAVELGTGAYIPHPAPTVLSNGYGDCKDHVALLGALLKAKGIDSEGVIVNSGNSYALTDVPTFVGLNHIITWLPKLGVYLDSTAAVAPFGVLPFDEYGKPAIFTSVAGARLGTIPLLPQGIASTTTTTTTTLDANGNLSGTTTTAASGPYSIPLRMMGLSVQTLGPEAAGQKLMQSLGYGSDATGELTAPPPTELAPSYMVSGSFAAKGWEDQLSGKERFHLPGGMRLLGISGDDLAGPFNARDLKPDAEVPCFSATASEDLSLHVPSSVKFDFVPDDVHVKSDHFRFDAHWSLSHGTISVHRSFVSTFAQPICTAEMRKAQTAALKEVSDSYDVQLSLAPAAGDLTPDNANPPEQGLTVQTKPEPWYAADIAAPPKDPKLRAEMDEVVAAMHASDGVKAMSILDQVLQQSDLPISVSYPALYDRAGLFAASRQYDRAIADLTAELAKTPGDTRMLSARAMVYARKADHVHAVADLDLLLAQMPNSADALYIRANCNFELANYEAAVRDYTSFLRITPQVFSANVLRGVAHEKLGQHDKARADIDQATKFGDTDAESDFAAMINPPPPLPQPAPSSVTPDPTIHAPSAANVHMGSNYPPFATRLGEEGVTTISFTIESDGGVSHPAVVSSSGFPDLDLATIESVRTWRYNPATQNGKPVAVPWKALVRWHLDAPPGT